LDQTDPIPRSKRNVMLRTRADLRREE
jgi:hypothetical protein